jgi:signal transduction histidine kinase
VERVQWGITGTLVDGLDELSELGEVGTAAAGSSLRELCHDLIEPTATIRWLVRAIEAESGEEVRDRLEAIAAAAGQIAAICEDVLGPPPPRPHVRLDKMAAEAVASARARYTGVIDLVSQPVTACVQAGDMVRIICNILVNACRAAGPGGRVAVTVGESDGRARLTIADSGHGLTGHGVPGRAGLGLEIIGTLALKYGGSVQLSVSELGGLAVAVQVPAAQRGMSN